MAVVDGGLSNGERSPLAMKKQTAKCCVAMVTSAMMI